MNLPVDAGPMNLYAQLCIVVSPADAADGITRREMMQRSLAAAAGVLLSERFGRGSPRRPRPDASSSSAPASAAWRRRTSCRRPATTSPSSRRAIASAAASSASRPRAGQERRGRRRADRIEPPDVGGYAKQFKLEFLDVDRGGRSKRRSCSAASADRRGSRGALGGAREGVRQDERRRREGHRSDRAVATPERRGARPAHAGGVDRRPRRLAALQARLHAMMTADNGVAPSGRAISATWRWSRAAAREVLDR